MGATEFKPQNSITRAEAARVVSMFRLK
ncbi:S-layer homology domain-containing protein [Bacillus sp. FJAT-45037]